MVLIFKIHLRINFLKITFVKNVSCQNCCTLIDLLLFNKIGKAELNVNFVVFFT